MKIYIEESFSGRLYEVTYERSDKSCDNSTSYNAYQSLYIIYFHLKQTYITTYTKLIVLSSNIINEL